MRDDALLLDQVWPDLERKLKLVRGEQRDLAGRFCQLVGIGSGVVGHGGRGEGEA